MSNEINAHAAALGVAPTASSASKTPPDATRHCCIDSSTCARHASDPVELAAARRSQIEAARDCLEVSAIEFAAMYTQMIDPNFKDWVSVFDRLIAACAMRELRKGAT